MLNMVKRLMVEEEGQGMTEYALVLGVIAIACIGLITTFSGQIQAAWTNITNNLGAKISSGTAAQ
ncbi:Flp family type IVb pilin [Candidatus Clostridium stratigraminis]|uniref:Flp family type IVb pilin n=1 Tax=Candidatus Clostridium stratigraminis TaxID=3381661 RepID=A0ABW8T5N3_9CLOT